MEDKARSIRYISKIRPFYTSKLSIRYPTLFIVQTYCTDFPFASRYAFSFFGLYRPRNFNGWWAFRFFHCTRRHRILSCVAFPKPECLLRRKPCTTKAVSRVHVENDLSETRKPINRRSLPLLGRILVCYWSTSTRGLLHLRFGGNLLGITSVKIVRSLRTWYGCCVQPIIQLRSAR